jgi:hypothetical protein
MIERGFALGLALGKTPGVGRVCIDGDLNAQTIRLEGNIGSRAVGGGIIVRCTGPECIVGCVEEPFSGQFSSVKARFPMRGTAVLARELARLPRSAIGLSRLMLHATGKGNARKPEIRSFSYLAGRAPVNLPYGLPGLRLGCWPASPSLILAGLLTATDQVNKAREQFDEPFSGHSDRGDDGQGDESGDEAVLDGGRAVLVAQKLPKHSFSPEL